MPDVFVSYSFTDSKLAREVHDALEEAGIDTWMASEDIPMGVQWDRAVQKALNSAPYMIVIHSSNSFESDNVWDEWSYFMRSKKRVIPLIFENVRLPYRLERMKFIDFVGQSFEEAIATLIAELQKELEPTPDPSGAGSLSPHASSDRRAPSDNGKQIHLDEDNSSTQANILELRKVMYSERLSIEPVVMRRGYHSFDSDYYVYDADILDLQDFWNNIYLLNFDKSDDNRRYDDFRIRRLVEIEDCKDKRQNDHDSFHYNADMVVQLYDVLNGVTDNIDADGHSYSGRYDTPLCDYVRQTAQYAVATKERVEFEMEENKNKTMRQAEEIVERAFQKPIVGLPLTDPEMKKQAIQKRDN